jgi:hypothetical protein
MDSEHGSLTYYFLRSYMPDVSETIDRELAKSAIDKKRNGETPNAKEMAAVKRLAKSAEEKKRWDIYHNIPAKHWREMSGRSARVIIDQALLYGFPFSGKSIDLPSVIRFLHDFLAANSHKLRAEDSDPILNGPDSPWLEEIRKAEAGLRNIKLEREQKTHVNITDLKKAFVAAFDILRRTGEAIQTNYGEGAVNLFNGGIDQVLERCNAILTAAQTENGAA